MLPGELIKKYNIELIDDDEIKIPGVLEESTIKILQNNLEKIVKILKKGGEEETIAWHMDCIKNIENYIHQKKNELKSLQIEIDRLSNDQDFYKMQINAAVFANKKTFNTNIYSVKEKNIQ